MIFPEIVPTREITTEIEKTFLVRGRGIGLTLQHRLHPPQSGTVQQHAECKWSSITMHMHRRGVAKGGPGGPGTPRSNPTKKLLRIKRVRTMHALRIRLIELWMSWMNWELCSISCYELGYFGLQLSRLCKNLVLRWRHLYRVPRTVSVSD